MLLSDIKLTVKLDSMSIRPKWWVFLTTIRNLILQNFKREFSKSSWPLPLGSPPAGIFKSANFSAELTREGFQLTHPIDPEIFFIRSCDLNLVFRFFKFLIANLSVKLHTSPRIRTGSKIRVIHFASYRHLPWRRIKIFEMIIRIEYGILISADFCAVFVLH